MIPLHILLIILNNIVLVYCKLNAINPTKNNVGPISDFLSEHLHEKINNILVTEEHDYLTKFVNKVPFLRTTFKNLPSSLADLDKTPQSFTILVSSYDNFTNMFDTNFESFFGTVTYFILTKEEAFVEKIAQVLWRYKLPHSFIIYVEPRVIKIYTLDIKQCGSVVSSNYVISLSGENSSKNISGWGMTSQLKGCPIPVIWSAIPPFVNNISSSSFSGIFIEALDVVSYISQRPILYRPSNPVYIEELTESYSYEAVMEDLNGEYAQMYIGPVQFPLMAIFDLSQELLENSLFFLVPRRKIHIWEPLMSIGIVGTAIWLFSVQASSVLLFYYMAKNTVDKSIYASMIKTYFSFSGFTLNVPSICRLPSSGRLRVYLGLYLLKSMIISLYIQGNLVSIISGSIYGKPIENLEQLIESGMPIKTMNSIAYIFGYAGTKTQMQIFRRIEVLHDVHVLVELGNIAVDEKSFATVLDNAYIFMRPNILKSFNIFEVFHMKQHLAMPKNAYFVEQYNEWIANLIEIGIIAKFTKLYEHYYATKHFVEEAKRTFVITFEQFRPALILVGFCYATTSIVFLGEIFVFRFGKGPVIGKILRYGE